MTKSKNPALHSLLKLVGDRNTITVHKAVVDFVGSLETAILFEQLLYWQPRANEGHIAKTDAELMEETYLSRYALRKARQELESMGLIKVDVSGFGGHKSTVYTPDMGAIEGEWATFVGNQTNDETEGPIRLKSDNQSSEIEQSNTETTTESILTSEPNGSSGEPEPDASTSVFYAVAKHIYQFGKDEIPDVTRQQVARATKAIREAKQDVTPDEIRGFVDWYARSKEGAHVPLDPTKLQIHFLTYRNVAQEGEYVHPDWRRG